MFRQGKMVAGAEPVLDRAFGIDSRVIFNHLQFVGEVLMLVGQMLVIRNLKEAGEDLFFAREGRFKNVTALESYINRSEAETRTEVFLGESASDQQECAVLVVFQVEKSKLKLVQTGVKGGKFVQIVLRPERKEALLRMGGGGNSLLLVNYERNRVLAHCQLKSEVRQVSSSPLRQRFGQVYVMSASTFRIFQVDFPTESITERSENMLTLTAENQREFRAHVWSSVRDQSAVIVLTYSLLTSRHVLLILCDDVLKHSVDLDLSLLKTVPADQQGKDEIKQAMKQPDIKFLQKCRLTAIAATNRGVLVGGSSILLLSFDLELRDFKVELSNGLLIGGSDVLSEEYVSQIFTNDTEELIVFSTHNDLGSMNFYQINTFQLWESGASVELFFRSGFHNRRILGLSSAVSKSIVASCSEDNCVKIWNFFEGDGCCKEGILSSQFVQEVKNLSLHPSGLFLAVGFPKGFRIYGVADGLFTLKECQLHNCGQLKYSHRGQYLTVAEKEHLYVYDTVYYEIIHLFTLTSTVKDFCFSEDDQRLVSTCSIGYVFCESFLQAFKENSQKVILFSHQEPSVYNCIVYDSDVGRDTPSDLFVGATNQKYLVIYKNRCRNLVAEFPVLDVRITALALSKSLKVLFAGTSSGTVRTFLWPLDEANLLWEQASKTAVRIRPPTYHEIGVHGVSVTRMELSADQGYLFSGAQDGSIICLKLQRRGPEDEYREKGRESDRRRLVVISNDLVLQKSEKLRAKGERMQKYKTEIIRAELRLKLQKEKLDLMSQQNMENFRKEFDLTRDNDLKMKETYVQTNRKEYEALLQQLRRQKDKFQNELKLLQESLTKKIEYEERRNAALKNQIALDKKESRSKMDALLCQRHQLSLVKKRKFHKACRQLWLSLSNELTGMWDESKAFLCRMGQLESSCATELERKLQEKQELMWKVREENKELSALNGRLQLQYQDLKREDERLQLMIQERVAEHNSVRFQNLKHDQDVLKMQHQLLQRLEVIDSKEVTCVTASYEQATLQNFRQIMVCKIQALQSKKKQMMHNIEEKEASLKSILQQLVKVSDQNETKARQLSLLRSKLAILENNYKHYLEESHSCDNFLSFLRSDLARFQGQSLSLAALAQRLRAILKSQGLMKELQFQQEEQASQFQKVVVELSEQKKFLGKRVAQVKRISKQEQEIRHHNIQEVISQNVALIEESKVLRFDNNSLRSKVQRLEKRLGELQRQKRRRENPDKLRELERWFSEQRVQIAAQRSSLIELSRGHPQETGSEGPKAGQI